MIVVVGVPSARAIGERLTADGLASRIAKLAAASGAVVQLVGKIGDDAAGDAVLVDLAKAGVGHAALLRDAARPTTVASAAVAPDDGSEPEPEDLLDAAALLAEPMAVGGIPAADRATAVGARGPALEPADLELALRYLVDFSVVVTAEPLDAPAAAVVAEAAAYAGARVVALVAAGADVPGPLVDATVLEVPSEDPDDVFARLVAGYAVGLDAGTDPAEAFRAAAAGGGWEAATA